MQYRRALTTVLPVLDTNEGGAPRRYGLGGLAAGLGSLPRLGCHHACYLWQVTIQPAAPAAAAEPQINGRRVTAASADDGL